MKTNSNINCENKFVGWRGVLNQLLATLILSIAMTGSSEAGIGAVLVNEHLITDQLTGASGISYDFVNQPTYDTQMFFATNPAYGYPFSEWGLSHGVTMHQTTRPNWGSYRFLGYNGFSRFLGDAFGGTSGHFLAPSARSLYQIDESAYAAIFGAYAGDYVYVYFDWWSQLDPKAWEDNLIAPDAHVSNQFILWGAQPNSAGFMLDSNGTIHEMSFVSSPVPEPNSWALLVLGFALVASFRYAGPRSKD